LAWFPLALRASVPDAPAVDLVLLFDGLNGMEPYLQGTRFTGIHPQDQVALVTFTEKSRVRRNFTNQPEELQKAVARSSVRIGPSVLRKRKQEMHLFQALVDAAGLFTGPADARKRAILLVYGHEQPHTPVPRFEEVREALAAAQVRLYAIAVRHYQWQYPPPPGVQTPPTIPGRYPPVKTNLAELPVETRRAVTALAEASGGESSAGSWDFSTVLKRIRNSVRP
jgi:hypothetical protein